MSRKTPRKSKLVPRSVDESTNLQTEAVHTLNNTPNEELDFEALIDNTAKKPNAPRQFNVTVAVEEVHDNVNKKKNVSAEQFRKSAHVEVGKKKNVSHEKFIKSSQYYILDREDILEAANKLAQTNIIADKLLAIEVSNCLGLFQKYIPTPFERKVQTVLDQWNEWQKLINIKFRSSPLMYKCYICQKSWWYFYDFREHLHQHNNFNLDLEEYTLYEANVIAYSNIEEIIDINHFSTDGDCPKCGNEFLIHKTTNRLKNCYYSCKVKNCLKKFPTCFMLNQHESTNHSITEVTENTLSSTENSKTCEVCGIYCTENNYQTHMTAMHSVRSDVIVPFMHKKCIFCQAPYVYERLHVCMKSAYVDKICDYCYRISSSTGKHFNTNIGCICKICNVGLPKQCMEAEHLLKHTNHFVMVKKCLLCDEFKVFLDDASATNHQINKHITWDSQNSHCITMYSIIIPKSCLKPENLLSSPEKIIPVTENMMPATEKMMPATEKRLPATEKTMSTTEKIMPIIKNITSAAEKLTMPPVAHIIVKREHQDMSSVSAPVLAIKQEIIDDLQSNTDSMVIKEEINYEDAFSVQDNYSIQIENNINNPDRIFGIKIENIDNIVKQEPDDLEQSDFEDDIIRLDFNYPVQDNQKMKAKESLQETIQKCLESTVKTLFSEHSKEDDDESVEESLTEVDQDKSRIGSKQFNSSIRSEKKKPKMYSCKKCGIQAEYRQYARHKNTVCQRKARIERVIEHGAFKCTKCNTIFESLNEYTKHFTLHGYEPKTCPECFKVYPLNSQLQLHLSGHIKKMYRCMRVFTVASSTVHSKCTVCDMDVDKNDFFVHWESHLCLDIKKIEVKSEPIDAYDTGSMASGPMDDNWLQIFLKRLQAPDRKKAKRCCMLCNRYFARRNDCKRHMIEHLLNDALAKTALYNAIKCQICGKCFKHPHVYKKHMRDHAYLPIYKCVICDKTFSDSSNFAKHKKLHNMNAYVCDTCGRKFQAKVSIEKHVKIHETLKPLICEPCNKIFYFRSSLNKHNKNVHDINKMKYRCTYCSQRFQSLKDKWDHLWHLHKERKSKADCQFCEKSYRKFSDLKIHLKKEHNLIWHKMNKITTPTRRNFAKLLNRVKESIKRNDCLETLVVYE